MAYADYTRNTAEPIKRIAHARRFTQALGLIASPLKTDRVLDYGCADAHLFSHFVGQLDRRNLVGYDPNPKLLAEASEEVSAGSLLTSDINFVKQQPAFSLIYCMEVCEHLTDKALDELLRNIKDMAAPHARIVFGVPIEIGPSGFLKSIYRMAHAQRMGAGLLNALRSLFGLNIQRTTSDVEWFGSHIGFNHRRLMEHLESRGFMVRRTQCLPFPILGTVLNNEVYFVCSVRCETTA